MKQKILIALCISWICLGTSPTQAQPIVSGFYWEIYDGTEFKKDRDSTWLHFSGSHSFIDVFGVDFPEYALQTFTWEYQVPKFPSKTSNYNTTADSSKSYDANEDGSAYPYLVQRIINTFDAEDNITEELVQKLESEVWINNYRFVYTHNENNQITQMKLQGWTGSAFVDVRKEESTYNEAGNLIEFEEYEYDFDAGAWIGLQRMLYEYDEHGNCVLEHGFNTLSDGSTWVDVSKNHIDYNGDNYPIFYKKEIFYEIWRDLERFTVEYDTDGNVLSGLHEKYYTDHWENLTQLGNNDMSSF